MFFSEFICAVIGHEKDIFLSPQCVEDSTKSPQKATEMMEWIFPMNRSGPFIFNHHNYTHIQVDSSQQKLDFMVLFLSLSEYYRNANWEVGIWNMTGISLDIYAHLDTQLPFLYLLQWEKTYVKTSFLNSRIIRIRVAEQNNLFRLLGLV